MSNISSAYSGIYKNDVFNDGLDSSVMGPVYLCISLLVILSNAVVVIVIFFTKHLHSPSLWNIAFMACCDLSMGLFYLICVVPSVYLQQFAYNWNFALLTSVIHVFLHGQASANILLATVDRYLAVCRPLKYRTLMRPKCFALVVVASVALNLCRMIMVFVPNEEIIFSKSISITRPKYDNPYITMAAVGIPSIIVLVVVAFILKILLEILRSRRQISIMVVGANHPPNNHQLSITMLLSGCVFCTMYIPSFVVIIWTTAKGGELPPLLMPQMGTISFLSNGLWNVIIYALAYRPFRDAWMRMFCKSMYRKQRQAEINATFVKSIQLSEDPRELRLEST